MGGALSRLGTEKNIKMKQARFVVPRSGALLLCGSTRWYSCALIAGAAFTENSSCVPSGPALFLKWRERDNYYDGPVLLRPDGIAGLVWSMSPQSQSSLYLIAGDESCPLGEHLP